jgi:hypothetical protein
MTSLIDVRCMQVQTMHVLYVYSIVQTLSNCAVTTTLPFYLLFCSTLCYELYILFFTSLSQGRVESEGPNNRLYDFVGNISLTGKK